MRLVPVLRYGLIPALLGLIPTGARAAELRAPGPANGAYESALIMDADTGDILWQEAPDRVGPPASMTKLMTFLVVQDRIEAGGLSLETAVKVTAADAGIGGTQVWLKEGEVFSVEELLYAMMIQSANDAAHALARVAAGSVDSFVLLMNARARSLGMTQTTFRTPHGLPPANRRVAEGDLTTATDFAKLSRHLLQHTDVLSYTSVRLRDFGTPQRAEAVAMVNHNNLLGKVEGVDGLKTGFTNGAGFCIAATAQRDGRRLIVVTMGGQSSNQRDLKVAELLNFGFARLAAGPAPASAIGTVEVPADEEPDDPLRIEFRIP